MKVLLNLIAGQRSADHRPVFGEFARRLAEIVVRIGRSGVTES